MDLHIFKTKRRWPRGVTPRPRSRAAAKRSYPESEVGAAARGATLRLRPEVVAGRTYPMPEARGSGLEDLPHA